MANSAAYNRHYADLDIINGDNPRRGIYGMRSNHEGVAVGGPYDGEQLQFWKETLPLSEIGAAFPFSDHPIPNVRRKWGHGSYSYDHNDQKWHWIDGRR